MLYFACKNIPMAWNNFYFDSAKYTFELVKDPFLHDAEI